MSLPWNQVAMAAEKATSQTAAQPSFLEQLVPVGIIFLIMYFLLIRPQAKKAREHQELVQGLRAGDEVVTSGGIIGRVKTVSDSFVSLDVGTTTLKVLKEHVASLTKGKSSKVQKS